MSNVQFGQPVLTNNYDPALLHGWGVRASDWNLGVSLQQQLASRASVEVAYSRRWYHGFTVNDNLLVSNSDYSTYSVVAPPDSRLPNGGGYAVSGLYDVSPTKSGQISNLVTDSQGYGNIYQYFNGVDVTLNVRMRNGLTFQGGTSSGQTVADACEARASLTELNLGIGAGLATSTVSPTSPLLPRGVRHPDAVPRPGELYGSEDRRAVQRRHAEQAGGAACGELRRAGGTVQQSARPRAVGQRHQRHGETCSRRDRCMATASTSSTSAPPRSCASAGQRR